MFSSTPWGGAALSRPGRLSRVLFLRQNFDVARCEGSLDACFFQEQNWECCARKFYMHNYIYIHGMCCIYNMYIYTMYMHVHVHMQV